MLDDGPVATFANLANGKQSRGSKPGERRGGRQKGTRNKQTKLKVEARSELIAAAETTGETPLEYMLRVMRTSEDTKRKDAMAIAAAPFIHPKLAAVEHKGDPENPVHTRTSIEFVVVDPQS